jgi:predicted NBD/HSP70 family sugar kinase
MMATFAERYPDHPYLSDSQQQFVENLRAGLEGDSVEAKWLIEQLSHALGEALANLVNLLNPERVVLTSWTAIELGPWLLAPTRAQMLSQSITGSSTATQLTVTEIGENPVGLGMATLALERFLEHVGVPAGRGFSAAPSS